MSVIATTTASQIGSRLEVAVVERGVAGPDRVVDDGERPGDVEVVVHGVAERLGQLLRSAGRERDVTRSDPIEEALDAVDGRLGLGERALVVLDHRAVVGGGEVVADGERAGHPGDTSWISQALPRDLLIFWPRTS
jgi:hypothetical protein